MYFTKSADLVVFSVLLSKYWNIMASHVVVLNTYAHTGCKKVKIYLFSNGGKVLHYGCVNLAAIWHKRGFVSPPRFTAAVHVFFQAVSGGGHMTPLWVNSRTKPPEKTPYGRKLSIFCSIAFRMKSLWNQKNGKAKKHMGSGGHQF